MSNNLQSLLKRYFLLQDCRVHHENNKITIQLTRKVDQQLYNRTFYWEYMDAIGKEGQANTLTYHFDNLLQDGERMYEDHPIIRKIMNHFQSSNPFYYGFEKVNTTKRTLLHPYLLLNIKIRYVGITTKEEIISVGLNLINGKIMNNMMELLDNISFHPTISPYCYMISPIIYLESGIKRIEKFCYHYLEQQTYDWAISANHTMRAEMNLVNKIIQDKRLRRKQQENIQARLQPTIICELINGGMLHIRPDMLP